MRFRLYLNGGIEYMEELINAYINEYIYSDYRSFFPSSQKKEWIPIELWKYVIFLCIPEDEIGENVFEEIESTLLFFMKIHSDDTKQVCINSYWPVDYQGEIRILYINVLYAYMNVVGGGDRLRLLLSMIVGPLLGKMIKFDLFKKNKKFQEEIRDFFQKYFDIKFDELDIKGMDLLKVRSELMHKYQLNSDTWLILGIIQEMTNYFKLMEANYNGGRTNDGF